jgi:hypothetical protein
MRIVSFDLGNTCGWARWQAGKLLSGVVDLSLRDDEHPGARWKRSRGVFEALIDRADWVLWERVIGHHRTASNLYVFEAQLVELCHDHGAQAATVAPSTLKKFSAGSGRSKNPEVLAAAQEKWPKVAFATHDEAHARFVIEWFLETRRELLSA